MAITDPKLIAQLLDLSRNVEKLSGEVKKNTTVSKDLVKSDTEESKSPVDAKSMAGIAEGLKSMDLKGLKDEFKGLKEGLKGIDKLDFKGLENGLKSLDFKGLEKGLKGLDFKGLEKGLKGLDFKGLEQGLKGFDVKNITESFKGITDLKNMDIGGMAKNLVSGGGVKDLISGSIGNIGKGLLGGFASGGVVKNPGAYLVGEKGPEIANLPKDATVIPNDKTEAILSGNPSSINAKLKAKNGTQYPTKEEIEAKKSELLKNDPAFYSDPAELNDEIEYYINNYKAVKQLDAYNKGGLEQLVKPTAKKSVESTPDIKKQPDIISKPAGQPSTETLTESSKKINAESAKKKSELSEKKPSLFSKMFSKENVKNIGGKIEGVAGGLLGGGLVGGLKDKLTGSLKGSAESLINKESLGIPDFAKGALSSGLSFLNKGSKESSPGILGDIKKNIPTLSNMPSVKAKSEAVASKAVSNIEQKSPIANMAENNPIPASSNTETGKSQSATSTAEAKPGDDAPITKKDIDAMLSALSRIASLLEGPLSVSSMDAPIRPDSRRI